MDKNQVENIIKKAINRHLVIHIPTKDNRDRIQILVDEASEEILKLTKVQISYTKQSSSI